MKPYHHALIAQLAHELTLSPLRLRLQQASGIQRTIELVEPERAYPYSFVCFQITGYRPRRTPDALLDGKGLIADLVSLLDALTADHPLPAATAGGDIFDALQLAARFNVSTKTISRWRRRGLAGCWYADSDGRPRLGFSAKMVDLFAARHADLVRRGAAFHLLDAAEKDRLVSRARERVAAGAESLHAVAVQLSKESGRAVETIRYTLRRFDRTHPETALFDRSGLSRPIEPAAMMLDAYRSGDSLSTLASRFGKTEADIRRALTRARADEIAASAIAYMYNEGFDAPDAERRILSQPARGDGEEEARAPREAVLAHMPSSLPTYLKELYGASLLSREQERDLFRRMNFLRHQAELLRQRIADDPAAAAEQDVAAVERLLDEATVVKNRIIRANLRLVVSIARRHLPGQTSQRLFELISDGNISLMRAVEKFDYSRGFRFSTYASWAIMRGYARSVPEEATRMTRFQTGRDELLADLGDRGRGAESVEVDQESVRSAVAGGLRVLDDRERCIVTHHFGLARGGEAKTLEQLGRDLGLSKERVRQIELRALAKLRGALGNRVADLLAG